MSYVAADAASPAKSQSTRLWTERREAAAAATLSSPRGPRRRSFAAGVAEEAAAHGQTREVAAMTRYPHEERVLGTLTIPSGYRASA